METPSSTRRVTRSQTLAASNNAIPVSKGKNEESEKSASSKTRARNGKQQQERSVLIDITNDSPIVGLAMETPSSAIAKRRSSKAKIMMMTPGSGEALLRGQVKTLLQKVEEEAELSKVSMENRPFLHLQGCVNSPMSLLAPTPANTPQIPNLSQDLGPIVLALPVVEEKLRFSEMKQEVVSLESQKSEITRSLLLDFSEKSESSEASECSSVVTDQGIITGVSSASKVNPSLDDDNSSVWSIQVNASACYDEDEEAIEEFLGDDYYDDNEGEGGVEEEEEENNGALVDELCEGMRKISMEEMFTGKHTRFIYKSDDEIEGEEECLEKEEDCSTAAADGILRLKGLPTPKGKHLRFSDE